MSDYEVEIRERRRSVIERYARWIIFILSLATVLLASSGNKYLKFNTK